MSNVSDFADAAVNRVRGFRDNLVNLVSGLGVPGRDKNTASFFRWEPLSQQDVEIAYRSNWIARKLIDIPAQDATRAWRAWQAKANQVEVLEDYEQRLGIQQTLKKAMQLSNLYGGAALIMGVDQGKADTPLNFEKIGKDALKFCVAVSRYDIGAGPIIKDVLSPDYGAPEYYTNSSQVLEERFRIHPSRVVLLRGPGLPNMAQRGEIWGDSLLQVVIDAIRDATMVSQSTATLVNEAKIDIIKIPDMSMHLATESYRNALLTRFQYANTAKSIVNTLLLDKEEEWERVTANFGGLPELLKMFLLIACGAADIPATRFLGQSAMGLNATGEGDLVNYYDRVNSNQTHELSPALARLDDVIIRSAMGKRDPSIFYVWNPLWQANGMEQAQIAKSKADAFNIEVQAGLVDPEALRIGRQNQLIEDGTYPGLEQALEELDMLDMESMTDPEERETQALAQMQAEQEAGALGQAAGQPMQQKPGQKQQGQFPPKKKAPTKDAMRWRGYMAERRRRRADRFSDFAEWEEEKHPREGKGSEKGGQFTSGSGGGGGGESSGPSAAGGTEAYGRTAKAIANTKGAHANNMSLRKSIGTTPEAREASYEKARAAGKPPGEGYSERAYEDDKGIIHTDDVKDVTRALYEGRKVNMVSQKMVAMAIDRLGKVGSRMAKMGAKATNFDLCNATVEGSNLFCVESKGIPRVKMPQLKAKPLPGTPASKMEADAKGEVDLTQAFREHLVKHGYKITDETEKASHLKASQNELNGVKIAGMAGAIRAGKLPEERLFISDDDYIVDGHHRWAANVAVDYDDNQSGDVTMPVARINMSIIELLAISNSFAREMGIPQAAVGGEKGQAQTVGPSGRKAFVSPNVGNLDFGGAVRELSSPRQQWLTEVSDAVDTHLGIDTDTEPVIGAWSDGAENSLMMIVKDATPGEARVAAAMKAWLADQKQALIFEPDLSGDSFMADFTLPNDPAAAHEQLSQAGLEFHTLQPSKGGTRVLIYGSDQETLSAIGQLQGIKDLGHTYGNGEFIGTTKDDGTDREQRDDARSIYEEIINEASSAGRLGRQNKGSSWEAVRADWLGKLEEEGEGIVHERDDERKDRGGVGDTYSPFGDWDPDQPRVPAGEAGGGQWTSGGGGGGAAASSSPAPSRSSSGVERAKTLGLPTAKRDPDKPVYVRVGGWNPKQEHSSNYARGTIEAGLSAYDLDADGNIVTPSEGEWAAEDLQERLRGGEPKFLVQGDLVGEGHDGEPLLRNVKVVGELASPAPPAREGDPSPPILGPLVKDPPTPFGEMVSIPRIEGATWDKEVEAYAKHVSAVLGFPPEKIVVTRERYDFTVNGKQYVAAGTAHRSSGEIKLYSDNIGSNHAEFVGLMAHEVQHQRFNRVMDAYDNERLKVRELTSSVANIDTIMNPGGTLKPPYDAQFPIYQQWVQVYDPIKLAEQDGVSDYSRAYWEGWKANNVQTESAIHETLAEIARFDAQGIAPLLLTVKDKPAWIKFYDFVNTTYDRLTNQEVTRSLAKGIRRERFEQKQRVKEHEAQMQAIAAYQREHPEQA